MENLTIDTFKEKIFDYPKSDKFIGTKPAIIDFYADWCKPCHMIEPILEELDAEYPDIDFYKLNTEEQFEVAAVFGIRNIPAVLIIPLTDAPKMLIGAHSKGKFKEAIKDTLKM
jgi:thioredoxin